MERYIAIGSLVVNVIVLLVVWLKGNNQGSTRRLEGQLKGLEGHFERIERTMREQMAEFREATSHGDRLAREEQARAFQSFSEMMQRGLADAHAQMQQAFANQHRATLDAIGEMSRQHKALLDTFQKQLAELTAMNERKLEHVRDTVERKLTVLQEDNSKQLEQMRMTVDEKLHQTLEKRLGESFQLVSERLELVHKGLGEMQSLASGVGDLKRVLTNVKTRGTLGEIQLENILEQVMSPEQYQRNVAIKKGSQERVDFVVRLPGKDKRDQPVLLPIDAKFPLEDYQRLMDAQEAGDLAAATEAAKLLESRIKQEAKAIQEKYLSPPDTTDFAIMFLPIEGLFAEVLRKSGLWDSLQRDYRVVVTGPTTITALLNSLQLGFRTLAIQQRSSEVWKLLGAVKTEFGKFGDILEKTQKKLKEASNTIDTAASKSRSIERKLKQVEAVPSLEADEILELTDGVV
ncbi:DNA recombination protein RmuC [Alicyclobacillus acidiphilus]|uniref:DNA recombination protein RmuC n=1 Tax=Alicyclobacillus acidiphilus TaxID=182455 RepID=UPI000833CF63|nr:DNA recombination protein RmuC [Alicyclobacillus acidiphilus]